MYKYHVFLDLEMNPIPKEYYEARSICRSEIIEIGAVKLDKDYNLIDRFDCFVKPKYNEVSRIITGITGIENSDLINAPDLSKAVFDFADWIGGENTRIYSWSLTDMYQLVDECWLKDIVLPEPLCGRWLDFQKVYTRLVGLSRCNALSLKNAIHLSGCEFDGREHRAVDDAENSAMLLKFVKNGEFFRRTKDIRNMIATEYSQFSISGRNKDALMKLAAAMGGN